MTSVEADGGSPALTTVPFPAAWDGGAARCLRWAARRPGGAVTWLPSESSWSWTTTVDPGAVGSVLDADVTTFPTTDVDGAGVSVVDSPTSGRYLAMLAAVSDGTVLTPAAVAAGAILTTGHPFFRVIEQPAGSTYVSVVVTLGATPPTITDAAGFTWTQRCQQQLGSDGWVTMWTAPLYGDVIDAVVHLSEMCDSGIGFALQGQAP